MRSKIIKKIINKISEDGLRSLLEVLYKKLKVWIYTPRIKVTKNSLQLLSFGTLFDCKKIFDLEELKKSTIISGGLGENASFDIEFASYYGARTIIIDPTPRAIKHYEGIIDNLGEKPQRPYSNESCLSVDSYDLSLIKKDTIILEKLALWTDEKIIKFYAPKNPKNVSYSVKKYQNNYPTKNNVEDIYVKTTTIKKIMEKYSIDYIPLLKIDIEGAEIEVIKDMLKSNIHPTQICVEFDGLYCPSKKNNIEYTRLDKILRDNGYLCYFFDGYADYLYALEDKICEAVNR